MYDFWSKEYLGAWAGGMMVEAAPTSCRVFDAGARHHGAFELISTSRHITQGWVDLKETQHNPTGTTWQGTSAVVKNDPYTLSFAVPDRLELQSEIRHRQRLRTGPWPCMLPTIRAGPASP